MADKPSKSQVGQYYLMEKLAQGGMAEIFKGLSYDVHGLKKTVCIKKILPHIASEEFIDSLINEAKIAVKMVHGNIAQTYDLGKVGDDYFMVMEYVDGKSLSQIHKRCLSRGELIPIPYLVYFISEVLSGLDYMHRRADSKGEPLGIVHRDISPQNVMVSYSGTVKIIDFGIAKTAFKIGSTDSGILKGKFAYMSPEQAYGDEIDNRSDIFSLGIILHEMLTGKRLFKATDSRETIRNVRRASVDPPSTLRPDLPDELDRIAMHALAKDRRRRYPFASEFRDELIKFLHTNYTDFKPSDAATFVQELFQDDLRHPKPFEADDRTPHLIIDQSNSALADDSQFEITGAARAPIDLSEYMLEETTGPPSGAKEGRGKEVPQVEAEETGKRLPLWRRIPIPRRLILSIALPVIVAASLAAIALYLKGSPKTHITPATAAEVMVATDPADASVLIDGEFAGRGSPVTIRDIIADEEHTIAVAKEGYVPHERRVKLRAGEFLSFKVTLALATPPTATVEIVTNPAGATIFLDDKETSYRTPATIENLDTNRKQTVGLYLKGYRFWSKSVELKGGQTKSFDIQLAKDYGSVSITSEPTGALVMIDGMPAGKAPFAHDRLEPGKIYRIEVWLEGYLPIKKEIRALAGRKEELRFTLEAEPTPAEKEYEERKGKEGER